MDGPISVVLEVEKQFGALYTMRKMGGKAHWSKVGSGGKLYCDPLLKSHDHVEWHEDVHMCEECGAMEKKKKRELAKREAIRYQGALWDAGSDEEHA